MKSTFFSTFALVTMAVAAPITPGEKRDLPGGNLLGEVTNILPVGDLTNKITSIVPIGGLGDSSSGSGGLLSGLIGKRDLPGADLINEVTEILPIGNEDKRALPGANLINEVTEILPIGDEQQ